ncbi:MAG: sugar phosphate isomerase/epimerase [Candidatus Bathyarchaeia archaeon]|nr:sugar phosphate isomerase/epimerase [Candidatus Bathyarchaeota archaeon]
MRVGIVAYERDYVKLAHYCHRIGVSEVCLASSSIEGYNEKGYVDLDPLKAYKSGLEGFGINLGAIVITRGLSHDAILGEAGSEREREKLLLTLENIGKTGIGVAVVYPLVERPISKLRREECWRKIIKFYDFLVDSAERFKVKLANHAFYHPWSMIRNMKTLYRLISEAPSPYNGVTYCPGLYQMGDDPYEAIIIFKEKIFFAHARNLRKIWPHPRFEEVPLDRGDIDMARVLGLLKIVGYNGVICPEHLGESGGERDLQAEAVEYLKSLLAKIDEI